MWGAHGLGGWGDKGSHRSECLATNIPRDLICPSCGRGGGGPARLLLGSLARSGGPLPGELVFSGPTGRLLRVKAILPALFFFAAGALATGADRPLMRDFIGINGHTVQFKPQLYRPVAGLVRDYHPVDWDVGGDPAARTKFPMAANGVDWSRVYGSWARDGWTIDASLMFESVPREKWRDLEASARSYGEAFARAFGPGGKAPFVESVEIGNEPGKWSDADYTTLARAMTEGLRRGNPRLRIATCNLTTGRSGEYMKSVRCIEGLLDRFDVLTVHTYPMVEGWPTWRRSFPEDGRLKDFLPEVERLCEWRDRRAPKKPIWITEFGYDASTKPPKGEGTFAKWEDVTDAQQAQWLVRSLLIFSAMPVERAYIYFFNDADEPSFHASSGLTRNFVPKPAFYAVEHLQRVLGDFRFVRIVENTAALRVQEYASESGKQVAWAAWSPTGNGSRIRHAFRGPRAGKVRIASMPLEKGAGPLFREATLPVELEIGESPTYLFFER